MGGGGPNLKKAGGKRGEMPTNVKYVFTYFFVLRLHIKFQVPGSGGSLKNLQKE